MKRVLVVCQMGMILGALASYRLRLERKRWRLRAYRKRRELAVVQDRTDQIERGDVLLASTIWNERARLPYFLRYYRNQGVSHFLIVDNGSDDGSSDYLARQADVSVWRADGSYKSARFGMDWINWLLRRHAHGHWVLTVDADEFLVYPFSDSRPIRALTDWLDEGGVRSFSAMLVDMYPKGPLNRQTYREGQDPFEITHWFDSGNYTYKRNERYGNLWIQGGARARMFFGDNPAIAPSLNKVPLVKWNKAYAYVNSTHMILPRGLNSVYDPGRGEKISGCLLHAKFLNTFSEKAAAELERQQHFANGQEYRVYHDRLRDNPDLWTRWSERYINWRQLEIIGMMSKGNWA